MVSGDILSNPWKPVISIFFILWSPVIPLQVVQSSNGGHFVFVTHRQEWTKGRLCEVCKNLKLKRVIRKLASAPRPEPQGEHNVQDKPSVHHQDRCKPPRSGMGTHVLSMRCLYRSGASFVCTCSTSAVLISAGKHTHVHQIKLLQRSLYLIYCL